MSHNQKPYDTIKRGIDIAGATIGLAVLAPVIGVVALTVRQKLGSPILFTQRRPGLNSKLFTLYKFRSMKIIDPANGLVTNEDRMTTFGKRLRATSLDELPSLFNVLKGDMSLVGPRPLLAHYLERYSPEQARRHNVRPGITGLAQINGRNALEWEQRLALDTQYVDQRSLSLDLKILLKTLGTAIRREGITTEGSVVGTEFIGTQKPCEL